MKPISPRPIFTLSVFTTANHRIIKNSHFLAFLSTQTHQNPGPGYHQRRQEEESRGVRVSVWWDFENCNLPSNSNVFRVAQCVTNAVRANGIKGPIQITAFGDVMQMSRTNQEALSSTGINLSHVPSGGKNSADRSLLVDLMYWVSQNPPPAHLFLISGDRDFAGILHRLRMNNYNILLASPDSTPSVLCSAATIMWQWSSLLKGENLSGKLFNQPPDGPYNSWYGHYKAPLENPFASTAQSSCLQAEQSSELAQETKLRPIPKAVIKHIRQILNSHPEGISIMQLRSELNKIYLSIDRDFYGHKKFSRFLLAMPNVLKIHCGSDGQFVVQGVCTKSFDESDPVNNNLEPEVRSVTKTNSEKSSCVDVTEKSKLLPVPEPKWKAQSTKLQEAQKEEKQSESSLPMNATNMQDPRKEEKQKESSLTKNKQEIREQKRKVKLQDQPQKVEVKDSPERNENQILVPNERSSTPESGIFRKTWKKLFGSGDTNYTNKNSVPCGKASTGKDVIEEKKLISSQSSEPTYPALFSPSSHEALVDGNIASTDSTNISNQSSSFFNQILSWFKFWNSPELDDKVKKHGDIADEVKVNSKQLDVFSRESFWNELESFLDTSQGGTCVSVSRNRVHLAQNLQIRGPPDVKSLSQSDLLHLVDLLISDKKWVEECDSRTYPFKLTRPTRKDDNPPSSSKGLINIFSEKQQNLHEFGEKRHQNPPHTGVPQPAAHKDSLSMSTNKQLADCQKLVDHIVKEYPEGFNMGAFRKLFLEKHGYALDIHRLGYEKLLNLLHVMHGVRVESNLIFPAGSFKSPDVDLPIQENKVVAKVDDSAVSSTKDDDSDSWDELGPINSSGSVKEKLESRLAAMRDKKRKSEEKLPDYEPLEEVEFSDSEEETSSVKSEREVKSKLEDESSLLQILDSWYSEGTSGNSRKDKPVGTTKVAGGTDICTEASKNESPVVKATRKQKPAKSYSFVTEQHGDDSKDMLVNGILGSLKKGGDKSGSSGVLS